MQYKKTVKTNKKSLFGTHFLQKHPTPAGPPSRSTPRQCVPFLSIGDHIGNYPFN